MSKKPILKQNYDKKSVTVVPSKYFSGNLDGAEEIEIHAQVHVPQEGGWGWVVVAASFSIVMCMDGSALTFGSIRTDMSLDLGISEAMVALINSIACALYMIGGPLGSALINRFGFRACTMAGSVICSISIFTSYFLTTFGPLCLFFGVFTGFGYSLINISSGLIVGFYFDKLRSVAMSITTVGGSLGVTAFYPLNAYLCHLAGWRSVILFHSGLFGIAYFLAMSFRPLLELQVTKTVPAEDPTRTVTYLPNISAAAVKTKSGQPSKSDIVEATATERLFAAVHNDHFPTAAAVVEQDTGPTVLSSEPGPSAGAADKAVSKFTITAMTPKSGISQRHLNQVKSMISKSQVGADASKNIIEITLPEQDPKQVSCWGKICHWEKRVPESRPMYRDDAFYDGKIEKLPEYQKSKAAVASENETGLEYELAVSRAAAAEDLLERRGVCTTALRRVLATMMDPQLLKRRSFQFICVSAFLVSLGTLVPYAYTQDRNLQAGMDHTHCSLFVSAIGGSNAIGRLVLGLLAQKFSPLRLYAVSACAAGLATIFSNFSFNVYFQYSMCCMFGFCVASVVCLRALMIVQLYGLQSLTNAIGVLFMFHGVGILISTPLAGVLKDKFGYTVAFVVAGVFITMGGLTLAPAGHFGKRENESSAPTVHEKQKVSEKPKVPEKPNVPGKKKYKPENSELIDS